MSKEKTNPTKLEAFETEYNTYKVSLVFTHVIFAIILIFILGGISEINDVLTETKEHSLLLLSYLAASTIIFIMTFSKALDTAVSLIQKKHTARIEELNKKYGNIDSN